MGGVVLMSDGIYNAGISPLYSTFNFPVYTLGIGDTLQHVDVAIKNVSYNKIAYEGNKFPVTGGSVGEEPPKPLDYCFCIATR
jgi:hypothetical protein